MRYISCFFAFYFLLACNDTPPTENPVITENPIAQTINLQPLSWLIGTWETIEGNQKTIEQWEQKNDTLFAGKGYMVQGIDTMYMEMLEIRAIGGEILYCPTVSNQNNGQTIIFKLTTSTDTTLVFENPTHDYPQKISYTKHSDQKLTAEISGMVKGTEQKQAFPLNRVK